MRDDTETNLSKWQRSAPPQPPTLPLPTSPDPHPHQPSPPTSPSPPLDSPVMADLIAWLDSAKYIVDPDAEQQLRGWQHMVHTYMYVCVCVCVLLFLS